MKTCKEGHEYDGELHDRCPECKRIAARNDYKEKAAGIAATRKAGKEALVRVPELEAENAMLKAEIAELRKEKVR